MNSQNNNEEPKLFTFTVPGKPQGKARARTFHNSKSDKMSSVTPGKDGAVRKPDQDLFPTEIRTETVFG